MFIRASYLGVMFLLLAIYNVTYVEQTFHALLYTIAAVILYQMDLNDYFELSK